MNASDFCDLVAGIDPTWIAAYLRIEPITLKRWKNGTARVPHSAVLALKVKLNGDVASFAGKGWEGFFFGRDGKLYLPYFKRGLEPMQLCAMFFEVQELSHLRRELKRITALYDAARSSAWAMQKVNLLLTSPGEHHANHSRHHRSDHADPDPA